MNPQQGLDLLRSAQDHIVNEPDRYEFTHWCHCVAGNFYRAATGQTARSQIMVVEPKRGRYVSLMALVQPVMEVINDVDYDDVADLIIAISNYHAGTWEVAVDRLGWLIYHYEAYYRDELGPQLMDIGKTERVITVTPPSNPVPERETEREQIPSREPERSPERTPEKVPARD